jgi:hypothetical protein
VQKNKDISARTAGAATEPDYEPKKISSAANVALTLKIMAIAGVLLALLWFTGSRG